MFSDLLTQPAESYSTFQGCSASDPYDIFGELVCWESVPEGAQDRYRRTKVTDSAGATD